MKLAALLAAIAGLSAASAIPALQPRKTCAATKPKVTVKKISNLCETKPGINSYTGNVSIPATAEFPFEQNVFFWLFESRHKPKSDPLTVWINGGPGAPSIPQALGSNGPCIANPDSRTTSDNPFSWNTRANLLYIDQPVQTGFSFDEPSPARLNMQNGTIHRPGDPEPPAPHAVLLDGVFSSNDATRTLGTSQNVACVLWTFMQAWSAAPELKPYARGSIHLWSQSYGGHYAAAIAHHFEQQSDALGPSPPPLFANALRGPRPIRIASLGIIAAFIDILAQAAGSFAYAYNNTYGIEIFSKADADAIEAKFNEPGGCVGLVNACRALLDDLDPEGRGDAPAVILSCAGAARLCSDVTDPKFYETGLDAFDITQPDGVQFPPPYAMGLLNRLGFQDRIGAQVNTTSFSVLHGGPFVFTGDLLRSFIPEIESLLAADVPVHLVYGDRDARSSWFGGEDLSLAIGGPDFAAAGYEPLAVAGTTAGHTRQVGRFSFTKVDGAGHEIPYYQPEAAYAIYQRALDGKDIATGAVVVGADYSTSGPPDVRGIPAPEPGPAAPTFCYTRRSPLKPFQCTNAQLAALLEGTAVVEDFVVVEPAWEAWDA